VALGCNIHDAMSAFVVVTDSLWTARTNAQGVAAFADVPATGGRLTVWQANLRAPGGMLQLRVGASQRAVAVPVGLRPRASPMIMPDY